MNMFKMNTYVLTTVFSVFQGWCPCKGLLIIPGMVTKRKTIDNLVSVMITLWVNDLKFTTLRRSVLDILLSFITFNGYYESWPRSSDWLNTISASLTLVIMTLSSTNQAMIEKTPFINDKHWAYCMLHTV